MVEKIKELIANFLEQNKIELVDISYRQQGGKMVLRLLVDKEGGIMLDECSRLNEEIGMMLDTENVINEPYLLEVSSPGLDRPLKTRRDFERVMGKRVNVHTYEPIEGRRDYNGEISAVDNERVTISGVRIPLNKIAKARLEIKL